MKIAILSGKGGTGKTTVATSLARVLSEGPGRVAYLDCDVEEPNGHLFLHPDSLQTRVVEAQVPEVDRERCTFCGDCGRACRFHAILPLKDQVLVFPKLCHACGGCSLACREDAICEVAYRVGEIEVGQSQDLAFVHGRLDIGQAMPTPVIKAVLHACPQEADIVLIDSPPGTSCPMVESLGGAEAALLVCEPTPFGLHDLKLAVDVVRAMGKPLAVVINRAGAGGDEEVEAYCADEGIPIVAKLPLERQVAAAYAQGQLICDLSPAWRERFEKLSQAAKAMVTGPRPEARPPAAIEPVSNPAPRPTERMEQAPADIAARKPKEVVVISGKGGTGKTSITASLAALSERPQLADCDVDASDLHLVCRPKPRQTWNFSGGAKARIKSEECSGCGICRDLCRFGAIHFDEVGGYRIDPIACEGCGVCHDHCPEKAIALYDPIEGSWFVSDSSFGPMVHARLGPGEANSGKLVTLVRQESKALAQLENHALVLVDGSPGIGCPVMASLTDAAMALIVTEPSVAGIHDLKRVAALCAQLQIPARVIINKADLHPESSDEIERVAAQTNLPVLGRIRYDAAVTRAQVQHRAVVELEQSPATEDIRQLWKELQHELQLQA